MRLFLFHNRKQLFQRLSHIHLVRRVTLNDRRVLQMASSHDGFLYNGGGACSEKRAYIRSNLFPDYTDREGPEEDLEVFALKICKVVNAALERSLAHVYPDYMATSALRCARVRYR